MTLTTYNFMEAIIREPAEDVHRLAYADWIDDEAGMETERAEFIRVQCELASLIIRSVTLTNGTVSHEVLTANKDRYNSLRQREQELFDDHLPILFPDPCWAGCVFLTQPPAGLSDADGNVAVLCRGFVSSVRTDSAGWLAHGPAVAKSQPLESVTLSDWEVTAVHDAGDFEMDQFQVRPSQWQIPSTDVTEAFSYTPNAGWFLQQRLQAAGFLPTLHHDASSALSAFSRTLVLWGREQESQG